MKLQIQLKKNAAKSPKSQNLYFSFERNNLTFIQSSYLLLNNSVFLTAIVHFFFASS